MVDSLRAGDKKHHPDIPSKERKGEVRELFFDCEAYAGTLSCADNSLDSPEALAPRFCLNTGAGLHRKPRSAGAKYPLASVLLLHGARLRPPASRHMSILFLSSTRSVAHERKRNPWAFDELKRAPPAVASIVLRRRF